MVVDAGHNWAAVEALLETLRTRVRVRRKTLIFAATRDKDVDGLLRQLLPAFDTVILTEYQSNPRAMPIAELLDQDRPSQPYLASIKRHRPAVSDPEQSLSARVLQEMRAHGETFAEFAMRLSREHAAHWQHQPLTAQRTQAFVQEAENSWRQQRQIEADDRVGFDEFLMSYSNQA